jgi:hypothetical protein
MNTTIHPFAFGGFLNSLGRLRNNHTSLEPIHRNIRIVRETKQVFETYELKRKISSYNHKTSGGKKEKGKKGEKEKNMVTLLGGGGASIIFAFRGEF